jgi:Domain of unknown function (DUF4951)
MFETPSSMDDVAELMRDNLPQGMTPAEFGQRMKWGRGSDAARQRIKTLSIEELHEISLSAEQATNWAIAYEAVCRLMPQNPSAVGRAEFLRHAARLLSGE